MRYLEALDECWRNTRNVLKLHNGDDDDDRGGGAADGDDHAGS